ncbi:hypothetical protein EDEG_01687 [Edhazardia aedis USNM 41457]|uniref:Phospholipid/glycerol acyltransferase domain-containing protein n=1 Tax=Edhazardia aedis (strain USNM 41457) TaxID=1003232 RepID=J9DRS8_EDHAE|nr:hypothetical protein EDEG_01687 [Edhazardia aedis USNM 41457]|eukprot:EJW04022.1 hypothetical protein EDEG_01687 [Edhazardia aedis USNM 41457]
MKTQKDRIFLHDCIDFMSMSVQSLEQDDFTQCFEPIPQYEMDNNGIFYIFGIIIRYFIFFPFRLLLLILLTIMIIPIYTYIIIFNKDTERIFRFICKMFLLVCGAKIHHHGKKEVVNEPHVYVANHTSFVDYIILSSYKFCHACISENHGGLFGFLFDKLPQRIGSISFKRSEKQDRQLVTQKMREHIHSLKKAPMLVFPEGTCVNNKFTVLFQKGAFEMDCCVVPVSIQFRRNLMDPYWNRRKHTFTEHIFYLMTRWNLEADVWWLDKEVRKENELPTEFAMRVKDKISERGGLKSVLWNGYFKSSPVIRDREIMRLAYIKVYSNMYDIKRKEKVVSEHRFFNRMVGDSSRKNRKFHSNSVEETKMDYSKFLNAGRKLHSAKTLQAEKISPNNNEKTKKISRNIKGSNCTTDSSNSNIDNNNLGVTCKINSSNSNINNNNNIPSKEKNLKDKGNVQNIEKQNPKEILIDIMHTETTKTSSTNTNITENLTLNTNQCFSEPKYYECHQDYENIDANQKIYFGKYTYNEFLSLVLKEYLKLKESKNNDIVIKDMWYGYQGSPYIQDSRHFNSDTSKKTKSSKKVNNGFSCRAEASKDKFNNI